MNKRPLAFSVLLILVATALLSGCGEKSGEANGPGTQEPPAKTDVVLATNPMGTGFYTIAAGQGALLTKKTDLNIVVQPTSGTEGVIEALRTGAAQLGLAEPTLVKSFWKGDENWKAVRAIQNGNILRFSFVTHEGTGIKTVSDLRGKRVSFTGLSAGHQMMAEAILKAYGLDPAKDVTPMKMSYATAGVDDLAEGRTDAVIASLAGSKMEELASKVKVVVLEVSEEKAIESGKHAPMLQPAKISKGAGIPRELSVVGILSVLYCTKDMSEDVAYTITKTLLDNYQELVPLSEELAEWTPENALTPGVRYPYHPGAVKYYKEAKLWTDAMEKWQQDCLAELGK